MILNEKLFDKLKEINDEYIQQIKRDVEKRQNRKGKQTKEEIKNEIKHQLSFLIWASIITFFSYHIFFVGFDDLKDGFKQVAAGQCMPSIGGVNHSSDVLGRLRTLLGFDIPVNVANLFSNSVCEIFRNSASVIIGAITMDARCVAVLTGAISKIHFPIVLKRAIASAVDVVFRCFEDPEYAAKVKADADKRIIIEDRKFKARKRKGFSLEDGDEEDEDGEEDEDDDDGDDDDDGGEDEEDDEDEAIAQEKATAQASAIAQEKMRIASEKASAKASEKASAIAYEKARKASEKERKASAIAQEKMRKANEKMRIASERASAKASEKERKASAKASEKERKAEERKQAAELKKSIKLAANAAANASKRKTQKVRINEVATNRPIQVLSINDQKSDPITKEEFDKNLRELGVYDEYYGIMKQWDKKCLVGTTSQKGGAFGFGTVLAIKAVIMGLFAGGTFYLNWDIFKIANANWTANTKSYLLKPGYETTLFVMNMFGLGPPCHARHGFLVAAAQTVMTGMSLASIFGMANLVGNNTVNTLGGFADYASMIYANLS